MSEELSVFPLAILVTIFAGLIWLACDIVLEGDDADVPALVTAVSINPDHRI